MCNPPCQKQVQVWASGSGQAAPAYQGDAMPADAYEILIQYWKPLVALSEVRIWPFQSEPALHPLRLRLRSLPSSPWRGLAANPAADDQTALVVTESSVGRLRPAPQTE